MALLHEQLTERVIGAAIEVHRALGPGLLESAYEECMVAELEHLQLPHATQVPVPLVFRGRTLTSEYRIDLLVADTIVVEIKAIATLLPVHQAQLLSYLRLARKPVGLLINFHVPVLKDGISRRVWTP
jgi:GxxExxY protein